MAASTISSFTTPSSSSLVLRNRTQLTGAAKPFFFYPAPRKFSRFGGCSSKARIFRPLAVVNEEAVVADYEESGNYDLRGDEEPKKPRPCELYVCNIPRSVDEAQLLQMFNPYGTLLSVEISRNARTGESRGCAYVTMGSINSAKNAVEALDGSEIGGREMRVRFSVEMNQEKRDPETLSSSPTKSMYYESPYKLYVGNFGRTTKPHELRELFSKFGTVTSARVLHDYKWGKRRAFAFLSFLREAERDAALSLDGTGYHGRELVVRTGVERIYKEV